VKFEWSNYNSAMTIITVSLAQYNILFGERETNFAKITTQILAAARKRSHLLVLPELWNTGYDLEHASFHAKANTTTIQNLCNLAQENHIAIIGSLLEEHEIGVYNTSYCISENGVIIAKYRKIHLFRLMEEQRWLVPGNELTIAQFPFGKVGLAICYDLRFPGMFCKYAHSGVTLFIISAEWPLQRTHHWKTLLQARAIENQAYLLAVNCVGKTGEEQFAGQSMVIDPWGNILAEADAQSECLITTSIDLEKVTEVRRAIPVLLDCRPDVYGWLSSVGKKPLPEE
jgi:omega-amidase